MFRHLRQPLFHFELPEDGGAGGAPIGEPAGYEPAAEPFHQSEEWEQSQQQ